jgi:predicted enzyme related to lactoylglutathione lyase
MSGNPIVYWELASNNAEKSVEFFKKAFGWNFEYDEKTTIHELPREENQFRGGGIFTFKQAKLPFLTIYIEVDDVYKKEKEIEKLGAFIVIPAHEINPGVYICLFNEPSGVTFAMIQKRITK